MSEVYKVAKFKLRISNRKKRVLKNILIKFTNACSEILTLLKPIQNQIVNDSIKIKILKSGKEKLIVDKNVIKQFIHDAVANSEYKNYGRRESLIEEISNTLSSYVSLHLEGNNPSFPMIPKYKDTVGNQILFEDILNELTRCGITENGIDEKAHEKETELAGELTRVIKNKLQPYSFLRSRDFTIIEQIEKNKTPVKIALLNVFSATSGKNYLSKYGKVKPKYIGRNLALGENIEHSSITKLPCILEWSLYHELNYFKIGTPKTAKLIYDNRKDEFFLHVTFAFIPHVDENGNLHYLKTKFNEKATRLKEMGIAENKKKKVNTCYDAITGELFDIESYNKTTRNLTREMHTYLGIDLGRTMLAAYAIVKNGKVLYKDFAETESLTKNLYELYDEIAQKQKAGKQNKKSLFRLYRKLMQLTRNSVHRTANKLIWARDYYDSFLILENLKGLRNLPRKKVQQYKRLSELLTYKSQLKGFPLVGFNPDKAYFEIKPSLTSKMCSRCGFVHKDNRNIQISQKDFKCVVCGFESNADINASINIARLGEYLLKYKKQYPSFDDYLINIARCPNPNYSSYFEALKRKKEIKGITNLLAKRITSRKFRKMETLG